MSLRGDSFVYFIDKYNKPFFEHFFIHLTNFEWSAIVFGEILSNVFKTNIPFYGALEVVFMLATVIFFYLTLLIITKRKLVSFAAALIVGTSYYGNWDMYAGGIYPWFLERIPLMLLLIPSFALLHKFLESEKTIFYKYSIILFFIGIGIAHWGVFFTAPFLFYPILWGIFNKREKTRNNVLIGISFALVSGFFILLQNINQSGFGPERSLLEYLLNPGKFGYLKDMVSQLVYWSTYIPFINIAKAGFIKSPITTFVIANTSLEYTPYILIIYFVAFSIIYKKLVNLRPLLFTILFSIAAIFFLNSYFGQYHIATQPGSNRYLYLPTYLFAMFWALFLWSVFWIKKSKINFVGHLVLIVFFVINYWLVYENFKWNMETYRRSNQVWNQAVLLAASAPYNSLIVLPNSESGPYEAIFLTDNFKNKGLMFLSDAEAWEKEVGGKTKVYRMVYDNNCKCSKVSEWENLKK